MSNQGSESVYNGKLLEKRVLEMLANSPFPFECQPKLPIPFQPHPYQADFLVVVSSGPLVIECKSLGIASGSLWNKLHHALHLIRLTGKDGVLVLDGEALLSWMGVGTWRRQMLEDASKTLGVPVVTLDELKEKLI